MGFCGRQGLFMSLLRWRDTSMVGLKVLMRLMPARAMEEETAETAVGEGCAENALAVACAARTEECCVRFFLRCR